MADIEEPPPPLPKKALATMFVLLFANAICTTAPFPFLPFMTRDFGYAPAEIGAQVGSIASARFIGNLLTAWLWGKAADKYGRRKTLLVSIGLQIFCTLLFAYTTGISVRAAAAARLVGGLLNGSVPIAKTYVGEISHPANQGRSMAIVMSSWQIGMMVGPAMGGFLSNAADKYAIFDVPWIRAFPYALPMVIIAGVCTVATLLGWLFLEETFVAGKSVYNSDKGAAIPNAKLKLKLRSSDAIPPRLESESGEQKVEGGEEEAMEGGVGDAGGGGAVKRGPSAFEILKQDKPFWSTALYAIISFASIGFDEIYSVWCATPHELGGLSWTSSQIGTSLMVFGGCTAFGMFVVYPKWERARGPRQLFIAAASITAVLATTLPFAEDLGNVYPSLRLPFLAVVAAVRTVANSALFVVASIFVNHSVTPDIRGTYNGLSFTVVAAVRATSPAILGRVFSWSISAARLFPFDVHAVFIIIGACYAYSGLTVLNRFDSSIEKPLKV